MFTSVIPDTRIILCSVNNTRHVCSHRLFQFRDAPMGQKGNMRAGQLEYTRAKFVKLLWTVKMVRFNLAYVK